MREIRGVGIVTFLILLTLLHQVLFVLSIVSEYPEGLHLRRA